MGGPHEENADDEESHHGDFWDGTAVRAPSGRKIQKGFEDICKIALSSWPTSVYHHMSMIYIVVR